MHSYSQTGGCATLAYGRPFTSTEGQAYGKNSCTGYASGNAGAPESL